MRLALYFLRLGTPLLEMPKNSRGLKMGLGTMVEVALRVRVGEEGW